MVGHLCADKIYSILTTEDEHCFYETRGTGMVNDITTLHSYLPLDRTGLAVNFSYVYRTAKQPQTHWYERS